MKIIRVFSKFFRTIFLLFITLILILNTQIKCEIKIFPDHHTEDDPVFNKSQVLDITNESFYYDLGYFTEKEKYFRSPKYGINYKPRKCELIENITGSITYEDNDITSFFGNDKQGIKDIESTLELGNRFEETKLFRNTMKGFNFSCPSPIRAFHHNDFEINMTIPMISTNDMIVNVILMSDDGTVNNSIGYISLTANEYQKVIFYITPKVENEDEVSTVMNFRLTPNRNDPGINVLINGDPKLSLQFITNADGLVLSNYRVTIEDLKTLAGTVFTYDMIRSKNGLLSNCTEDEDCFIGFMCTYFNCTPCHRSCTECYQDDFNPAGLNYCKKCNVMSVTEEPKDGYCSIGYVDVTKFEDFEVKVKPDGEDYDDRHTLGFWLFLADTNLSRSKDNDGPLSDEIKNGPNPQKNDILHHVVLKDRLVITIIQRVKKFSVYCHVYEDLFSMNVTDKKVFDPKYLLGNFYPHPHYFLNFTVPSDEQKEVMVGDDRDSVDEDFHKTIDGHWVHVSCAESFDHGLYYLKTVINGKVKSKEDHLEHAPFRRKFPIDADEDNPPQDVIIEVQSDKYFKHIIYDDNTLLLQFKNWHLSRSKVYFRHLTLFKEYIPIKMQYMYFDYHNIGNFYELLYYLPFDQLYYGTVYKIKGYSYEYKEEDIFLNFTKKNIKDEKDIITPALNFKHLNFPPVNKKYKEIDLTPNEYNPLLKNDKQKYVYDDYQAMCCEKYLDTNKNECDDTCINFHEVPFVGVNDKSGYCDYTCQESMTCLYDQPAGNNLDYDGGFCTELSKAYNLFYRCEDNQVDYYLQYSGFYNSAKMEKKIKKMYSYLLEFWYYDDYFLKHLGKKFYGDPSHGKHYILHTNVIDFYFTILKQGEEMYYDKNIYYMFFDEPPATLSAFKHQEWNRIYIYSRYNRTIEEYEITVGLNSQSNLVYRNQYYPTNGALENIIFCDKVCKDFEEKVMHWATGYYKNFRIWDGNNASPKILAQYDTFYPDLINRVSAIKYYFPMTNKYISNNRVIDPKNKEEFVIAHGKYYFRKYNYCSTFDILEAQKIYGTCNYYLEGFKIDGKEISYTYLPCYPLCERCWCTDLGGDNESCRKCRVGSYLTSGYRCNLIGSYFFKSPNLLNRNLDAKVQKITLIENKPAVTVTFWSKTFGFAGDDHIVMFQIGESLEIVFSSSDDDPVRPYGLSVVIENRLISNVFDFRNQIGDWVFFSIAHHKEISDSGTVFFPTMMKFELQDQSYAVNISNVNPLMNLDSFTIKKDYFGLVANVKFYDRYIIGSLGYEQESGKFLQKTPFYVPVPVASFFVQAPSDTGCFDTSYLEGANINDFECVPDENPSYGVNNDNCYLSDPFNGDNARTTNLKKCFNLCYGNNGINQCSCINYNYNSQMIFRNNDKNACRYMEYINFANSDPIVIDNVQTARETKRYTMQFWMYAYNYLPGRFGGVTFFWDGHNKIIVQKGSQSEGNNKYEFHCIPYAEGDTEAPRRLIKIIEINKWNYLSCAVDFVEINYYINVNTYFNELELERANLIETSPTNLLLTQTKTTLSITDNSKFEDWGVLFFKHIRLWKWCYFNAEFLSRLKLKTTSKFPYLLEQWEPEHGMIRDFSKDYFDSFIVKELSRHNTFRVKYNGHYGMNVVDDYFYNDPVNCTEDGQYYDVAIEKCLQFIDLSKMKDFQFNNLPYAYSGSYSMSIWIFLEDASVISQGLHINWSQHLQITIIRTTRLEAYCFPQGYYSDSVSNENIQSKFSNSLNVGQAYLLDEYTSESATWINVICSVSHYNREYYVNGMDEKSLSIKTFNNEYLYKDISKTTHSFYPMRYFFSTTSGANNNTLLRTTLSIQKITNTKRIYFRSITLFRDYIPYWYNKILRNMNLVNLEAYKMPSVLFFANFAEFTLSNKNLVYRYQFRPYNYGSGQGMVIERFNKVLELADTSATFELCANFRFMPLCEFSTKTKMKYDPNRNYCVFIADCDLTELNAYYCMEERTPICCLPHYYITSDDSGQIYCRGGCINEDIRNPGTHETQGICNSNCIKGTKQCPGTSSAHLSDYQLNYKCEDDRYRIGYHCVESKYNERSSLFFSKCYNSPSFTQTISDDNQYLFRTGYFLEFWFKLDHMLDKCQDSYTTKNKEYYFYSIPHTIYLDTTTNIFYYENTDNSALQGQIAGINDYEWNKVYIRTRINEKQIDLFLNFEIANPKLSFTDIENTDLQISKITFCARKNSGNCGVSGGLDWGSAYYKNIRIWDERTATIRMVQDFNNKLFTEFPNSLILFYPLTIQYMDINVIQEIITGTDSFKVSHSWTKNFKNSDEYIFYNYEINHDWGEDNPGYFIASLGESEEDNGVVTATPCDPACRRCFSAVATNCYECNEGYVLNGMECIRINGYFLKIPANTLNTIIPFKIEVGNTKVKDLKAWTFCIYMKFEGILAGGSSQARIIMFRADTYIAYDVETTNLVFIVGSQEAFRDENFHDYFGTWIPICVANYVSGVVENEIYPNMLTINVNKIDIPFSEDYEIPPDGVKIDQLSLHYEVIAFFADFRIYTRFLQGNFGTIISSTNAANYLLIYYSLSGNNACIQADYLTTTDKIDVNCVPDYNIYVDSSRKCTDVTYYFDVQYDSENIPCASCDRTCVTLCFQGNNQQCTCDMYDGLYWLRKHKTTYQTYCEYLPYIDFSAINDVSMYVPSSSTYESTIEVWFYAYSYNLRTFNFKQMTIEWNLHNKLVIVNKNNELFAKCYALWDESRELFYTEYIEQKIYGYKWNLLRCGSEFISNDHKYFFNDDEEDLLIEEYPVERIGKVTTLKIKNIETSYDSYGFVFLRELKLWQQYNYMYIDTSTIDLQSFGVYQKELKKSAGRYPGLIAFYKNDFKIEDWQAELNAPHKYTIINLLGAESNVEIYLVNKWVVTRRTHFIGYNIVDPNPKNTNYKELTLCAEGEVYNPSSDTCSKPLTTHCEYPGDLGDKCISCKEDAIYINIVDGSCTNECPVRFYPRDDINQCRACHFTCYTCTGPFYNNCTSCEGSLALVPDLHICIEYCEDYGLTTDPNDHNMCIPFDARARLVNYQENVPIDLETFEKLIAEITYCSAIECKSWWDFDANATRLENNDTELAFPFDLPYNGDRSNLETPVDNTFFVLAKKYVVNLIIIAKSYKSDNISKSVNITVPFVLTINASPKNGRLIIAPEIGLYNTTTFLIMCKNYDDDTTKNLLYIFYAKENGVSTTELLRGWSSENEITRNFTVNYYQMPSSTVTIYCYIRDNYGAITIATKDIKVASNLNNGIYNLPDALTEYSLPTLRTDLIFYHRSQYLMSLGIDMYKVLQPNLHQTKYEPSRDSSMMTKTDPVCTLDFCNNNGYCDLMDEFINCHCDTGFIGRNCHVEKNGYESLAFYYNELFDKIIGDIQESITWYEFETFHNLYFGACQFIQDKNFFSINLDTFLTLAMSKYKDSILNNTPEYFDLLDYYYSYELMLMEQQRGKIKYLTGLKVRNITLDEESMEDYKQSFNYINEELIKLMKYIANEYMPTKGSFFYESKNFYLALAPIERGFDEKEFFKQRRAKYKSHLEFMNCVNYIEIERLKDPNYYLYLFFIEYYYFPYAYNNTILRNNTGPLLEVRLFDTKTGKFLSISGCENNNLIKYKIPYSGYYFLEEFNLQKAMYDPNVYKGPDDPIFADPIYIMDNGNVTDSTIEERIKLYNRMYNITPRYYDEMLEDFNETGVSYLNFTNDTNYIVFSSTHLTQFTAFFVPNNATFHCNGRFFYLMRPKIFLFFPNYLKSLGGLIFLILLILYLMFLTILKLYDKKFTDQEAFLEYLKEEIVDLFLHYKKPEDKIKEKEEKNLIPNRLKKKYNHRNFFDNRDYGPNGFGGTIMTSGEDLKSHQIYGPNTKKKGFKSEKFNEDFLDDLDLDDDDVFNMNFKKGKAINNNFFYGGDVKSRKKNAEEELKRKKIPNFFYGNRNDKKDNINRGRYHHNALPEEFENADEARSQQIEQFAGIGLTFCEFLILNIKSRSILINSFCVVSVFNPRWKKLSLLMTEFCVILIFVSVFLTSDENAVHTSPVKMVIYSIYSMLAADGVMYLVAIFFKFPNKKERRLFTLVTTGGQLSVLREWEIIEKRQKIFGTIGMCLCGIIWLYCFYSIFGFTVVWKYQNKGFIECFAFAFIFNFIACEFLIELLIAICYTARKHNCFLRGISEGLNRLRNYRCLSP